MSITERLFKMDPSKFRETTKGRTYPEFISYL